MKTINIWFNRTFSATFHLISNLKKDSDGFKIKVYGTHPNINSVFLQACDYIEQEPTLTNEDYINYALTFCKNKNINFFIPGENSTNIISKNINLFNDIGVIVGIAFDKKYSKVLCSKIKTYEFLKKIIPDLIPSHYKIDNFKDFNETFHKIKKHSNNTSVCFKPDNGVGGLGFRIIDDNIDELKSLYLYPNTRAKYTHYENILKKKRKFPTLIMMKYLNGTEISVDCIANNGKLIFSVAKVKKDNIRIVKYDAYLNNLCYMICEKLSLNFIFNIQFRYDNDHLYLLDINPRISGGLFYTDLAGYSFLKCYIKQMIFNDSIDISILPEKQFMELKNTIEYKS